MPRRFERHRRAARDWDTQPSRSTEVQQAASADPDPVRRAPARKDTRSWCKGKRGAEHVPLLVLGAGAGYWEHPCQWRPGIFSSADGSFPVEWACRHREVCQRCGKVLREPWGLAAGECPAYPGSAEQHAKAAADAEQMNERHQSWLARVKPVITGRQGYRRKRESA